MAGNVAGGVGDTLVEHFFGADKGGKLMFGEFHRLLRTEVGGETTPTATPPFISLDSRFHM